MVKNKISKKFDVVQQMPPLYHKIPNEEYDNKKSQVIEFLSKDEDGALNWLFRYIEQKGLIVYDPETGKWQGKDYGL